MLNLILEITHNADISGKPWQCPWQWPFQILSIFEGSLEVKLPTIWTNEKQRWEESEKRREEERKSEKRKSQKKEDPGEKVDICTYIYIHINIHIHICE